MNREARPPVYPSRLRPYNPATPGKGARRRRDSASRSICTQRLRRGHPYPLPLLVGYEKINLKCLHPSLTVRSLGIRSLSWQQRNGTSTCPMRRPLLTASAIISVANSMPGQVHVQREAASRVIPRIPQWKCGSHQLTWNRYTADCYRLLSDLYVRASPLYQDYRAIPTLAAPPTAVETPPSPPSTDLEKKDTPHTTEKAALHGKLWDVPLCMQSYAARQEL